MVHPSDSDPQQPCAISQLPTELLLEIIVTYVEPHRLDPLVLSHVCHNWRMAAIGLEMLWSSIGVHSHENSRSIGVKELTKMYLDRSGSYPLDIFLNTPSPQIFHIIARHSLRWASLHLRTSELFFRDVLDYRSPFPLERIRGLVPLLKNLVIEYQDHLSDIYDFTIEFNAYQLAPQLRNVYINTSEILVSNVGPPLETIEHVTLGPLNSSDARELLSLSPQLRTARFLSLELDSQISAQLVQVPNLSVLEYFLCRCLI